VLKQDQKVWAKRDEMLINDTLLEEGPVDPFKTIHMIKPRKKHLADKISQIDHYKQRNLS
jgi:hypothetical protein